jgi:hypothetical protein
MELNYAIRFCLSSKKKITIKYFTITRLSQLSNWPRSESLYSPGCHTVKTVFILSDQSRMASCFLGRTKLCDCIYIRYIKKTVPFPAYSHVFGIKMIALRICRNGVLIISACLNSVFTSVFFANARPEGDFK